MARISIDDLVEPSAELDDDALDAVVGGAGGGSNALLTLPSGSSLTPGQGGGIFNDSSFSEPTFGVPGSQFRG